MLRLEYWECLDNDKIRNAVWDILCICDHEFVPALSARNSSSQPVLAGLNGNETKPVDYFQSIQTQKFIICKEEDQVIAFLTFKLMELKDAGLSNYMTTVCVLPDYRNQGISKMLYHYIEYDIPEEIKTDFLATRTWSENGAQIHTLQSLGFKETVRLKDHRGKGIDTLYYVKKIR